MITCRAFVVSAVFVFALGAHAATIAVPGDATTIQQAIDRAAPGDIVSVKAGQYNEHVLLKPDVSLVGEGKDKVIVQSDCNESPVLKAQDCVNVEVTGISFKHLPGQAKNESKEIRPVCHLSNCTLKLIDCAVSGSPTTGVVCQGKGGVVLRGCSIGGNAGNGVWVTEDAVLLADKTDVSENTRGAGLWVSGPGTKLTLQDCTVTKNGVAGVYANDRATLKAAACKIQENAGEGLAIMNQNTKASVTDCVLEGNGRSGLFVDSEATDKVEARGNTLAGNATINQGGVQVLMINEQFDALEAIAKRLRDEKLRWANGDWQLDRFYYWLALQCYFLNASNEAVHFARLEKWKTAYPDSITWRLVLAASYRQCGWRERGTGFASIVTEKGWQEFAKYLGKAQAALDEARAMEPKDPAFYVLCLNQALEYHAETKQESVISQVENMAPGAVAPDDRVAKAFEEGVAVEPEYFPLYYARVRSLLPEWGGNPASMLQFAEESEARTEKIPGACLYSRIAWEIFRYKQIDFTTDFLFSWKKIDEGYRRMIQHYPNPTSLQNALCRLACAYDDKKTAQEMFTILGSNWDDSTWSSNASYGAWKKWALENGPHPGNSLLALAVSNRSLSDVVSALANGEDPNTIMDNGMSVLARAIDDEDLGIARLLIEKGADVNLTPKGSKPNLLVAMENESLNSMQLLLENKADPNVKSPEGWPLLSVAVTRSMPKKAILLLEYKADPNQASGVGTPPLTIAIAKHLGLVVAKLVECGADVNAPASSGNTPLLRAAHENDLDSVKLLIEKGAKIDVGNNEGWTPLMEAARLGNLAIVRHLVEKGADVNKKPSLGASALTLAKQNKKTVVVEYLTQHGAKD
ncbi:MAG: ankyrin repeat domain-containing protein [Candidatus Hydrogenedentes bacterium]|nr:ankyrin repeat domain-containing protein [Candidatus Hydrogenedentota bacterium]